jgi:broad specificity phosphatase PhoE
MKRIFFVRHGESEANAAGITAGARLNVGLTKDGRQQALKVGEDLKGKGVDLIVSSPLKRAYETAAIIAQTINYDSSKIISSPLFIERDSGELTGKKNELVRTYYDAGILPASAETTESLQKRTIEGLEWLKTLPANNIVLVSHGGPGRMIRTIYRQENHNQINSLDRIGNAEILELSL